MVRKLAVLGVVIALLTTTVFASADSVYVVANGVEYHKASCPLIKKNQDVKKMAQEKAIRIGYKPCKKCFQADLSLDAKQAIGIEITGK